MTAIVEQDLVVTRYFGVEGVGNWKLTYKHSLSSKMWSVLLVLYRLPYFVPDEYDMIEPLIPSCSTLLPFKMYCL